MQIQPTTVQIPQEVRLVKIPHEPTIEENRPAKAALDSAVKTNNIIKRTFYCLGSFFMYIGALHYIIFSRMEKICELIASEHYKSCKDNQDNNFSFRRYFQGEETNQSLVLVEPAIKNMSFAECSNLTECIEIACSRGLSKENSDCMDEAKHTFEKFLLFSTALFCGLAIGKFIADSSKLCKIKQPQEETQA